VLFDKICNDNGITHILTAPRSPTTTGKVERWHKTLRREFLDGKVFESIADAQAARCVGADYNHERPHQSLGGVPPIARFKLAEPRELPAKPLVETGTGSGPVTTRRVSSKGTIGFATVIYKAGVWLPGQTVEVSREGWSRSTIVECWSRPTLAGTRSTSRPPAWHVAASPNTV
jgi:Integrase core domain